MLFLLFQLGGERYALEVSRVVEVLPLLSFKQFPHAPPGIAGIFNRDLIHVQSSDAAQDVDASDEDLIRLIPYLASHYEVRPASSDRRQCCTNP